MKNMMLYLAAGLALLALGIYGILSLDAVFAPVLVYLGAVTICLPATLPFSRWREMLNICNAPYHPMPHEPLFLIRMFLSLSWIARREGILALEEFLWKRNYPNHMFHMGLSMVLDGYDPEFVQRVLKNTLHMARQQMVERVHCLRQMGASLFAVGLFGGIVGIIVYGLRLFHGQGIASEGAGCFMVLTVFALLSSVLIGILLPSKLQGNAYLERRVQQQVVEGLLALQCGNSPTAIEMAQSMFLSDEEKRSLDEQPMFDDMKSANSAADYEDVAARIRQNLQTLL